MRILAIETACPPGSIALLDGPAVVAVAQFDSPRKTTQQFATLIRDQLQTANWSPGDVQVVAVTHGPGSFTGLRIGVTAAKVFAYAVKGQVISMNTLAVVASQCPATSRDIETAIDAQRNQLFAARFRQVDGGVQCLESTSIMDAERWLATRTRKTKLIGPGLQRLRARLSAKMDLVDEKHWVPRAESLGVLAMVAAERGELMDPMELTPQYFRKSAAEEKIGGP